MYGEFGREFMGRSNQTIMAEDRGLTQHLSLNTETGILFTVDSFKQIAQLIEGFSGTV